MATGQLTMPFSGIPGMIIPAGQPMRPSLPQLRQDFSADFSALTAGLAPTYAGPPYAFVRFGDGERHIMGDKWHRAMSDGWTSRGNAVSPPWDEGEFSAFVDGLLEEKRPILLAAGPLANCIAHEYVLRGGRQVIIDIGSVLDLRMERRRSRNYHRRDLRSRVCLWTPPAGAGEPSRESVTMGPELLGLSGRELRDARKASGLSKREFHARLDAMRAGLTGQPPPAAAPGRAATPPPPAPQWDAWHRKYAAIRNADPRESDAKEPLLTILVPTVPARRELWSQLMAEIERQAAGKPVEIISVCDNRFRTLGEKRNDMLRMAQAPFVTQIDDDDWIAPDYVDSILAAIVEHPTIDVICFDMEQVLTNGRKRLRQISVGGKHIPNQIMAWRTVIARRHYFPNVTVGEDVDWANRINGSPRTQHRIDRVLYYWRDSRADWGPIPGPGEGAESAAAGNAGKPPHGPYTR